MPVTTYASVAQFFGPGGAPPTVVGALSLADVQASLEAASGVMDDSFRGVFPLPFDAVGASVALKCVHIARYLFLNERGFSPVTGSDERITKDYEAALEWLDKVQRRVLFPDVTINPNATAPLPMGYSSAQPFVLSSSVVNDDGGRAPTRGW